jgi:hypothetical protein
MGRQLLMRNPVEAMTKQADEVAKKARGGALGKVQKRKSATLRERETKLPPENFSSRSY